MDIVVVESSNLPSGAKLQGGKYKIVKVLGQGGFGITYLAEQTGLGMNVAIKEFFLKGSCQRDSSTSRVSVPVTDNKELVSKCQRKFKSEARKIASLNNDHIVNIIDIFDENGTSYYVMKYLSGGSLADKVKDGAMSEQNALRIIDEVSDALGSIHSHGLLHLDIKPANILFDERDRAVLIDFGVSKYLDNQTNSTSTSTLIGFSRGFAPLEQVNSMVSLLSPATDIYSLGATLYYLVVGTTPPDASSVMESGLPAFPLGVSDKVQNTIEQAMQPRRIDRPQDIGSFLEMLSKDDSSEVIDDPIELPVKQPKSKPWFFATLALFLCSFILAGIALYQRKHPVTITDNSKIEALEAEVKTLNTKNNSLQNKINEMKSSSQNSSALQKQVEDLTRKNSSQASQISTLQRDNTNLQNQVSSLKSQVNSLKPDAEKWRRSIEVR